MKRLLLTWYGMTDLRAAFEVENTTGPILGLFKIVIMMMFLCFVTHKKAKIIHYTMSLKKTGTMQKKL
ncbi:hypothetical protein [Campylobacter devanensis]|uniref:hypothetical protein n=1 Tax=Campylobacter devanensis TaxID=3161138 RepID=UPI00112F9CA5|nr:hypothetical protein [Campylobacter sp. P160]